MPNILGRELVEAVASSSLVSEHEYDDCSLIASWFDSLISATSLPTAIHVQKWDPDDVPFGDGSDYKVRKATIGHVSSDKTVVAIKRLIHKTPPKGETYRNAADFINVKPLIRDMRVMQCMKRCPNIVDMLSFGLDADENGRRTIPTLVVEFAQFGDLSRFLKIHKEDNEEQTAETDLVTAIGKAFASVPYGVRKSLMTDVAMGLLALHQASIFHTDVKPKNVLVFASEENGFKAKLADFGSALIHDRTKPEPRFPLGRDSGGTKGYKAPELIGMEAKMVMDLSDLSLQKADVYSFGVLAAETLSSLPWSVDLDARQMDYLQSIPVVARDLIPEEDHLSITRLLQNTLCEPEDRFDGFHAVLSCLGMDDTGFLAQAVVEPGDLSTKMDEAWASYVSGMKEAMEEITKEYQVNLLDFHPQNWVYKAPLFTATVFQPLIHLVEISSPAISLLRIWRPLIEPANGPSPESLIVSAFSYAADPGWSPNRCFGFLVEASKMGSSVAKIVYRRVHQALSSNPRNKLGDVCEDPGEDALADIDPDFFAVTESIASQCNFVVGAILFFERLNWLEEVCALLFANGDMSLDIELSSWPVRESCPTGAAQMQSFLQLYFGEVLQTQMTELPEEVAARMDLFFAAAIIFDDGESGLLELACKARERMNLPLGCCFQFLSLPDISPLFLACLLGKSQAVRTLSRWDTESQLTRLGCSGCLPLHFLFLFPDEEMGEMLLLLSGSVEDGEWQALDQPTFAPAAGISLLAGTPLDFAILVGSDAAVAHLWSRFRRFGLSRYFDLFSRFTPALEGIADGYETEVDIYKCFAACSSSIWNCFAEDVEEADAETIRAHLGADDSMAGGGPLPLLAILLSMNKLANMLLHGPKYFDALVQNFEAVFNFLGKHSLHVDIEAVLDHLAFSLPDPDIHGALGCAVSAHFSVPRKSSMNQLLTGLVLLSNAEERFPAVGRCLGLSLPDRYRWIEAVMDIQAATRMGNMYAISQIVERARSNGICLRAYGVEGLLLADSCKIWRPHLIPALDVITKLDAKTPWYYAWEFYTISEGSGHAETGFLILEAIKHGNKDMLLLLVERDKHHFSRVRGSEPNVFHILCTNDRYEKTLKFLLRKLPVARSQQLINEDMRWSRLTPIDIAIHYRSRDCLSHLSNFIRTEEKMSEKEATQLTLSAIGKSLEIWQGFTMWRSAKYLLFEEGLFALAKRGLGILEWLRRVHSYLSNYTVNAEIVQPRAELLLDFAQMTLCERDLQLALAEFVDQLSETTKPPVETRNSAVEESVHDETPEMNAPGDCETTKSQGQETTRCQSEETIDGQAPKPAELQTQATPEPRDGTTFIQMRKTNLDMSITPIDSLGMVHQLSMIVWVARIGKRWRLWLASTGIVSALGVTAGVYVAKSVFWLTRSVSSVVMRRI